ncbi:DUF1116 domain-containing protein [Streptomyces aureus]
MPLWTDVRPAGELIPELAQERLLLHAGPPIEWQRMCGPMRAAVVGAALLEGWAATAPDAEALADAGAIRFAPCHHHDTVGPMAGVISASMPLLVVEDEATGLRAYSNLNEGQGRCLRYGALGDDVMKRLRWMGERLGPALRAAIGSLAEPVNLRSVTAQALQMGDECHSRNTAASALLTRELSAALARHAELGGIEALDFLRDNNYWFLNFSMAASKLALLAGHGVPHSTVVTAFARNGVDVGIRVSGLGDSWFTAPAAPWTASTSPDTGPPTPTRTSATAPSPRCTAWADSRWPPPRRSSASWAAPPKGPAASARRWRRSPSAGTATTASPASTSSAAPSAWTSARSSTRASNRSSPRASRTANRASARSAPASPTPRCAASRTR